LDFVYCVYANEQPLPHDAMTGQQDAPQLENYWRAEVHLAEGGQDYDVMNWTQEQILNDVLGQYERHLNYLNGMRPAHTDNTT
jgi:choline/glycine/proline betaine transport protein